MGRLVNSFFGRITMYRLVLYYLAAIVLFSVILSAFSLLPYNPTHIISNTLFFLTICYVANTLFAQIFKVTANYESTYITALILSLIIGPVSLIQNFFLLTVVGTTAMASKYLLTIHKKHIFNPAGFAALFTGIFLAKGASWWIGDSLMQPLVIIGGLLIIYKVKRFKLVAGFLVIYLLLLGLTSVFRGDSFSVLSNTLVHSPILFFSSIMLIDPSTIPFKSSKQIIYAVLVALALVIYQTVLGSISYTLELALLTGNLYAYFINKNFTMDFKFQKKHRIARKTLEFIFDPMRKLNFVPGQFLEWTLAHPATDLRGNRRYFTISSSPTEKLVTLTTKIIRESSSFKKALMEIKKGETIVSSRPGGEFVLPDDSKVKLAFIAGGIGITPFRSMIKFLLDNNERRDIKLIYTNKTKSDIAYKNIFDKAEKKIGLTTLYLLTERAGHLNIGMIKKWISDHRDRMFYVSGPEQMVHATKKILREVGVDKGKIKKDYFPGY